MSTETYHFLIYKKLAGYLDPQESVLLDEWLKSSAENRQIAAEIEAVFNASASQTPSVNVPEELSALKSRLHRENITREPELAVVKSAYRQWYWVAAASVALIITAVFFFQNKPFKPEWVTVSSSGQQNKMVELPDGSHVWLNRNSEISYVQNMNAGNDRQVQLKGEAFFEVARNPAKPFRVEFSGYQVEVLGTSFNIRSRERDSDVEVGVQTGKVRVTSERESVDLTPGQSVEIDKNAGKMKRIDQSQAPVAEWRSEQIVFQNLRLAEAIARLNRRFEQQIILDNTALSDCRYTAYFPRAELKDVLTNIKTVFGLEIEKTPEGTRLKGGRCPG